MADFSKQWCESYDPDMPWDFDIIEEANHKALESPVDFESIIKQAKKDKRKNILLLISRDGKPSYLPLRIDGDEIVSKPVDKSAEKKPEESKIEASKSEEQKSEKPEATKLEAAKPEAGNPEAQKNEAPKLAQKADQVEREQPKTYQVPENLGHREFEEPKQDEVHDVQDADHHADKNHEKEEDSSAPLATDNKNALEIKDNDSWTSRVVNKLRSIFGRG